MKFLHFYILALLTSGTAFAQCGLNQEQYTLDLTTGSDGSEISWSIGNDNKLSSFGVNHQNSHSYSFDFCLDYGTHYLDLVDLQGNGWSGASYSLKKPNGSIVLTGSGPTASYSSNSFLVGAAASCQDYDMTLSYSIPEAGGETTINLGDTIEICWDINMMAIGTYPNSGVSYDQSDATTDFSWNISGLSGGPYSGQSISDVVVDDFSLHLVTLTTSDANACQMQFQFYIHNPTPNTTMELSVSSDTICVGETSTVFAEYENNGQPPIEIEEPDPVYLDDVIGNGSVAEYNSTITLDGYDPLDTITDSLCIKKICLELEHSYVGDLTIHFVTPTGDTITLLEDQNGSGNGNGLAGYFFGEPIDDGTDAQGVGYSYCWTPSATQTIHDIAGTQPGSYTFPETIENTDGTFANDLAAYDVNPFSNAVGSPINGDWQIIVLDTYASDDGYIFGWNFELCVDQSATVSYVDSFWVSTNYPNSFVDPSVDSSQTEIIGMEGDQTQHYQYHVIDNNGCEWFEEISVYIWDSPVTQSDYTVSCDSMFELGVLDPNTDDPGYWTYIPDTLDPLDADFIPNNQVANPTIQVYEPGVYEFEYNSSCGNTITQTVTVDQSIWEVPVTDQGIIVYCFNSATLGVTDSNFVEAPGHWEYVAPPGGPTNVLFFPNNMVLEPTVIVPELGTYEFIYYNSCGRSDVQTLEVVQESPDLNIPSIVTCDFDIALSVTNFIQAGSWTASSAEGNNISIDNIANPNATATVDGYGTYTFTFTFEFCDASFSQDVEVVSENPEVSVSDEVITCDRTVQNLTATVTGQGSHWEASGPGNVSFVDATLMITNATVSEYGDYTFYYYGCNGVDSLDVTFEKEIPLLSAPTFVECGLEALLQINYAGDLGTFSVTNSEGATVQLDMIDNNTYTLTSDEYDQFEVSYQGCDEEISTVITFFCELIIPNVFSPDNDAVNQEFSIERLDTRVYNKSNFNIYDRWGKKVYHNGQYGLNGSWWDGKDSAHGEDLEEGIYYYTLVLHNYVTNKEEKYTGSIHLFR